MALSDYEIPFEEIALPRRRLTDEEQGKLDEGEISEKDAHELRKCSFRVRGLSLMDVEFLVAHHLGDLSKAVELYHQRRQGRMSSATLADFAMILARDLPILTVETISRAAEEEDQQEKIAKLPAMIQINALLAICKLTTEEAGGLKNLLAFTGPLLKGMVGAGASEPGTLKRTLLDFIGGSDQT